MKTIRNLSIILILAFTLGACSSSYKAGVSEYDDLYYTPRDARMQSQPVEKEIPATAQATQAVEGELSDYEKYRLSLEGEYKSEEVSSGVSEYIAEDTNYYASEEDYAYTYYDDGSQPPVVNNYYGTVNQYPSYSSRIQRFHSPYLGYSYYDPWYYSSYYDPFYYDPWYSWGPRFSLSIGYGIGWGYGGWGYPSYGWGYPGWGYGSYYSSYWRGYNHGLYDGYYYGGGYYYPTPYADYSD